MSRLDVTCRRGRVSRITHGGSGGGGDGTAIAAAAAVIVGVVVMGAAVMAIVAAIKVIIIAILATVVALALIGAAVVLLLAKMNKPIVVSRPGPAVIRAEPARPAVTGDGQLPVSAAHLAAIAAGVTVALQQIGVTAPAVLPQLEQARQDGVPHG